MVGKGIEISRVDGFEEFAHAADAEGLKGWDDGAFAFDLGSEKGGNIFVFLVGLLIWIRHDD